jgi:hypothetical protein
MAGWAGSLGFVGTIVAVPQVRDFDPWVASSSISNSPFRVRAPVNTENEGIITNLAVIAPRIAAAEARGSSPLLDGNFARDLEEVINSHPESLDPPASG